MSIVDKIMAKLVEYSERKKKERQLYKEEYAKARLDIMKEKAVQDARNDILKGRSSGRDPFEKIKKFGESLNDGPKGKTQ